MPPAITIDCMIFDVRVYFVNGAARGRSWLDPGSPTRLTWDESCVAYDYRRVTSFRGAHFYRHTG